jgi:hypothetical protein
MANPSEADLASFEAMNKVLFASLRLSHQLFWRIAHISPGHWTILRKLWKCWRCTKDASDTLYIWIKDWEKSFSVQRAMQAVEAEENARSGKQEPDFDSFEEVDFHMIDGITREGDKVRQDPPASP